MILHFKKAIIFIIVARSTVCDSTVGTVKLLLQENVTLFDQPVQFIAAKIFQSIYWPKININYGTVFKLS